MYRYCTYYETLSELCNQAWDISLTENQLQSMFSRLFIDFSSTNNMIE